MIKRPLPILLLFFIGGIVLGYSTEIPRPWVLGSLAAGLILSLLAFITRRHAAAFCLIGVCFFTLGIHGIGTILYDDPAADHIAHWAEKGKFVLDGVVSENPRVSEDRTSLVLEATRVSGEGFSRGVCGKLLLSVGENTRRFKVGDLIRTETRLKHPRSFGNPGAFNYERYLRLQGIRVRGFVNDPRKIVLIREGQGDPARQALEQFRTRIRDRIRSQAPFPEGTLIQAMTLGEQSEIPRAIQDRFNRTGTSHIIAISGFNVGIIALIAFFLIRTLLKTSETLLLRFNIQRLSALFAFAPVVFYAFVAGLGMSTVRALLMTLALLVTILMGRGRDLFNTLALAAFAILVVSPAALFDISFQLSFTAVAAILLIMPGITERLTAWKNKAEGRPARTGQENHRRSFPFCCRLGCLHTGHPALHRVLLQPHLQHHPRGQPSSRADSRLCGPASFHGAHPRRSAVRDPFGTAYRHYRGADPSLPGSQRLARLDPGFVFDHHNTHDPRTYGLLCHPGHSGSAVGPARSHLRGYSPSSGPGGRPWP